MALAYLFKRIEQRYLSPLDITAFVVNHKAREGSSEEAQTVCKWLREMGPAKLTLGLTVKLC